MADARRQSSGPVAMPARGPASSGLGTGVNSSDLVASVGARVKVTTALNHVLEGTLYAADPKLNLLAVDTARRSVTGAEGSPLAAAGVNQTADIHIVAIGQISSFTVLSHAARGDDSTASSDNAYPPTGPVNPKAAKTRLDAEVRKLQEQESRRGKGVGKEAQDVFDALVKTLPTRWHETSIIVLDSVRIDKPYRVEDCKASAKDLSTLNRVKLILDIERKRLGLASTAAVTPKPATPVALPVQRPPERKGG